LPIDGNNENIILNSPINLTISLRVAEMADISKDYI
jgi:hypothetical protein